MELVSNQCWNKLTADYSFLQYIVHALHLYELFDHKDRSYLLKLQPTNLTTSQIQKSKKMVVKVKLKCNQKRKPYKQKKGTTA